MEVEREVKEKTTLTGRVSVGRNIGRVEAMKSMNLVSYSCRLWLK